MLGAQPMGSRGWRACAAGLPASAPQSRFRSASETCTAGAVPPAARCAAATSSAVARARGCGLLSSSSTWRAKAPVRVAARRMFLPVHDLCQLSQTCHGGLGVHYPGRGVRIKQANTRALDEG